MTVLGVLPVLFPVVVDTRYAALFTTNPVFFLFVVDQRYRVAFLDFWKPFRCRS